MNKVDNATFEEAVEIAHRHFWLADCPNVEKKAKEYICSHPHLDHSVGEYVAVICRFVQVEEKEVVEGKFPIECDTCHNGIPIDRPCYYCETGGMYYCQDCIDKFYDAEDWQCGICRFCDTCELYQTSQEKSD